MFPDDSSRRVSHETIYNALYVMLRGMLKKELIACLRQRNGKRRPRSRGKDRRGQLPDLVSIHQRPPEIEDRLMPGHWEGDLIMGADNRSAVGTLVYWYFIFLSAKGCQVCGNTPSKSCRYLCSSTRTVLQC